MTVARAHVIFACEVKGCVSRKQINLEILPSMEHAELLLEQGGWKVEEGKHYCQNHLREEKHQEQPRRGSFPHAPQRKSKLHAPKG